MSLPTHRTCSSDFQLISTNCAMLYKAVTHYNNCKYKPLTLTPRTPYPQYKPLLRAAALTLTLQLGARTIVHIVELLRAYENIVENPKMFDVRIETSASGGDWMGLTANENVKLTVVSEKRNVKHVCSTRRK